MSIEGKLLQGMLVRSRSAYHNAFSVNSSDARLLYELDQLERRLDADPASRYLRIDKYKGLLKQRDDLTFERITLLNQLNRPDEALTMLLQRRFHPWEGGEGLVSAQYVCAHTMLGIRALDTGRAEEALHHFQAARVYPESLGGEKHFLASENQLLYFADIARLSMERKEAATESFRAAAAQVCGDAQSEPHFWRALALKKLDREREAVGALFGLRSYAELHMEEILAVDYFATSLPDLLIFQDDLEKRNQAHCTYLRALAKLGLGQQERARKTFERVLTPDPNHLDAQQKRARLGFRGEACQ